MCAGAQPARDPEWASGLHLLVLLAPVRPGCVASWDAVCQGATPGEQEAKARVLPHLPPPLLLGLPGPALAWQDVVAVKPRAILLFLDGVCLLDAAINKLTGKEGDKEEESEDEDSPGEDEH